MRKSCEVRLGLLVAAALLFGAPSPGHAVDVKFVNNTDRTEYYTVEWGTGGKSFYAVSVGDTTTIPIDLWEARKGGTITSSLNPPHSGGGVGIPEPIPSAIASGLALTLGVVLSRMRRRVR